MTERNWLWAAIIVGGVILGSLWFKKDKGVVAPGKSSEGGWVPSKQPVPPPQQQQQQQQPPLQTPPPGQPPAQPQQPPMSVYDGLLRNAKDQNKQMVLFFTAKNCKYCEMMKKDVLPNVGVQQALNRYIYHVVDLDLEPSFGQKFNIKLLPTIMVIDGDEQIQKQTTGYMSADVLINWLGGRSTPPSPNGPIPRQQPQQQPQMRPQQPNCPPGGG